MMKWSDEYLIKIPELDKEHKLLSEMINGLHESILTNKDCKVVNKIADELVSYTEKHFKNEEELMCSDAFPDAVSHKLSHDKLLRQLKELIKNICSSNKRDISKISLLDDWFVDHLLIEDKKYGFYAENENRYRLILEGVNVIGWEYDPFKDCFTFISGKAEKITGYTPQQWREKGFWAPHIHPEDRDFALQYCKDATDRGEDHEFEYRMIIADGGFVWFRAICQVVFNNGKVSGLRGMFIDVTEKKKAEELLQEQKKALEQKNIALNEVIAQVQLEKQQVKEDVMANVENLLLPVIEKIRQKGESGKYLKLLQKNLQELTSSFSTKLTEKRAKLTSREIEVCNMIKNGSTSKEIAGLLNISVRTSEKHRGNIRKKLGIVNKDFNLASFLKTL